MRKKQVNPGLPAGPRAPAAVNTAALVRRPLESLLGWHARYGDLFTVRLLVFGLGVYVCDPDAVRELFTGDQSDLHAGEANAPLAPVLGDRSVLLFDGEEHLRHRRLLLAPFRGAAERWRAAVSEVAEAEVDQWRPGERFVAQDRMRQVTFEVIARVVFGVADPERIARLRSALVSLLGMSQIFLLPGALRRELGGWSPGGRFARRLKAADALIYEEIDRRRADPGADQRSDVLSLLLAARDEDGKPLEDRELRDELMTMLLAGYETTATALAFALDLLPRHPVVLARLRDELEAGDQSYLDAVVSETLRLRPVIDAPERTLTVPRTICGCELPAGIRVYPSIAVIHHRDDLYPQPEEFRPERFLDGKPDPYMWLPFGGGIRRCIGATLAQTEIAEVIRTVVTRAELTPLRRDPERVVMRGVTLAPRHGTPVEVTRMLPARTRSGVGATGERSVGVAAESSGR